MRSLLKVALFSPSLLCAISGYVPNVVHNDVSVFDIDSNTVTTTIAVGNLPTWIAFVGQYGFVTNYSDGTVTVIDSSNNTVVGSPITVQNHPVYAATYGSIVYVVNSSGGSGQGSISVIDSTSKTLVATILSDSFDNPYAIAFINHYGYIANQGTNTITVIDTNADEVIDVITLDPSTGTSPQGVAANGSYIYVANSWNPGAITVIDAFTNTVVDTIASDNFDSPIDISFVGNLGFVSNNGSNTVSVINVNQNSVQTTFPISMTSGSTPYGSATYARNGVSYVYVANYAASSVSAINSNTFAYTSVIDTDSTFAVPNSVSFPNPVNFPTHFQGTQKLNNFGTLREYYNTLTWASATGSNVSGYYVYRNGSLIATVSGASSTSYQDHNRNPSQTDTYVLYAFDGSGNISIPQAIQVK